MEKVTESYLHEYDLHLIFKWLSQEDRKTARHVCKHWNHAMVAWYQFRKESTMKLAVAFILKGSAPWTSVHALKLPNVYIGRELMFVKDEEKNEFFDDLGPSTRQLDCRELVVPPHTYFGITNFFVFFPHLKKLTINSFELLFQLDNLPTNLEHIHIEGEDGIPSRVSEERYNTLMQMKHLKRLTSSRIYVEFGGEVDMFEISHETVKKMHSMVLIVDSTVNFLMKPIIKDCHVIKEVEKQFDQILRLLQVRQIHKPLEL